MEVKHIISIKNNIGELKKVFSLIGHFIQENKLDTDLVRRFSVCADEIISNTIFHGYSDDKEHDIRIELTLKGHVAILKVEDDAAPFNLLEIAAPDIHECAEKRRVGGLGIHMVKNLVDRVDYVYEENKNKVTLIKKI